MKTTSNRCILFPLLTWKANCPEKSYMPQECIRLRVFLTASGLSTRSPVIGQIPPLARVAAMTLALSQVTSIEHSCGGVGVKQRTVCVITTVFTALTALFTQQQKESHTVNSDMSGVKLEEL